MKSRTWQWIMLVFLLPLWSSCGKSIQDFHVDGKNIRIDFNHLLHSRVVAKFDGKTIVIGEYAPSEFIDVGGAEIKDFTPDDQRREAVHDQFGSGQCFTASGSHSPLKKTVIITVYDEFPSMAFFEVQYTNIGNSNLSVDGWTNHAYALTSPTDTAEPAFWSFQSGSYQSRPDWILPLKAGFKQDNYLGMNASDYGGGTPIVDVWRKEAGIGVGHIELSPKLISLPVSMPDQSHATVALSYHRRQTLKPGAALATFRTFVSVHQGDYFRTLSEYRRLMVKQGIQFTPAPDEAFAPIWCAWGFGRDFKVNQIYNALPIVKKLGFTWVTLDDGWQTAEGDWFLNKTKFPNGDRDIKALVDRIHGEGFRAQLWWAPLAVDPRTELITRHPEQLLLNADGSKQKISWWDAWYLCPADPAVVEYHQKLVVKIIKDWGFDGLKLDGQHLNGVPPCYNPAHRHATPEASVESLPDFFKAIYSTALNLKKNALVELCPCGTSYSFFAMPFMNMSVASDPGSSWQVRLKAKTLKALMGDSAAYFGDHVDMSDGGDDFASTVGVGGVIGTNFIWPVDSGKDKNLNLTPQKEKVWDHWTRVYKDKMLSRGEYLGSLYDIGFDRPETHAIRKGEKMYYAFYAAQWNGDVELRGLDKRTYRVTDYANGKDWGTVNGPTATLKANFQKHLLLEAKPE